jgi:hypothetical protein
MSKPVHSKFDIICSAKSACIELHPFQRRSSACHRELALAFLNILSERGCIAPCTGQAGGKTPHFSDKGLQLLIQVYVGADENLSGESDQRERSNSTVFWPPLKYCGNN